MRENRRFVLAASAMLVFVFMNLSCSGSADRQWEDLQKQYLKLCYAGRYSEALPLVQQALELAIKTHGPKDRLVARTQQDFGRLMFDMGKKPEAESLYLSAKAIFEQGPNRSTDLSFAACLRNLGRLYYEDGRFDLAQSALEACLAIEMNAPHKEQAVISMVLGELGGVYYSRGLVAKAVEKFSQSREVGQSVWTERDLNQPSCMSVIGFCWAKQGRVEAAAALTDSAYQMTLKLVSGEDPITALMMQRLAYCRQVQRKYEEAERLYKAASQNYRNHTSIDTSSLVTCYMALGNCSRELGNLPRADSLCTMAAVKVGALGTIDSLLQARLDVTMADLRRDQGHALVAESLYQHAIEIFRAKLKKESWYLVEAYQGLGDLYLKMKRLDEARTCYEKAIASGEVSLGLDAPRVGHLLEKYATILSSLKLTKEAEAARRRASAILSSS